MGLTGSITFFVLGLVFGSCSGFAIPVAQDFGAKDAAGVKRRVANIVWIGIVFAILMTAITVPLTKQILVWMDVPKELMGFAYDYLVWIFVGIGAQMMYNLLASIIRALGDSKTPLYFLIICSILNIGLDIFCIKSLNMGVKGAAIATGVAQLISGAACLIYMVKKFPMLRLSRADMKLHLPTVKRLIGIGLPMGLQFSITAIGSIILQKAVNNLGTDIIAGVSAGEQGSDAGYVANGRVRCFDGDVLGTELRREKARPCAQSDEGGHAHAVGVFRNRVLHILFRREIYRADVCRPIGNKDYRPRASVCDDQRRVLSRAFIDLRL